MHTKRLTHRALAAYCSVIEEILMTNGLIENDGSVTIDPSMDRIKKSAACYFGRDDANSQRGQAALRDAYVCFDWKRILELNKRQ